MKNIDSLSISYFELNDALQCQLFSIISKTVSISELPAFLIYYKGQVKTLMLLSKQHEQTALILEKIMKMQHVPSMDHIYYIENCDSKQVNQQYHFLYHNIFESQQYYLIWQEPQFTSRLSRKLFIDQCNESSCEEYKLFCLSQHDAIKAIDLFANIIQTVLDVHNLGICHLNLSLHSILTNGKDYQIISWKNATQNAITPPYVVDPLMTQESKIYHVQNLSQKLPYYDVTYNGYIICEKYDVMCLGNIFCYILTGDKVNANSYVKILRNFGPLASNLLRFMTDPDPITRISLKDVLNHPYFKVYKSNPQISSIQLKELEMNRSYFQKMLQNFKESDTNCVEVAFGQISLERMLYEFIEALKFDMTDSRQDVYKKLFKIKRSQSEKQFETLYNQHIIQHSDCPEKMNSYAENIFQNSYWKQKNKQNICPFQFQNNFLGVNKEILKQIRKDQYLRQQVKISNSRKLYLTVPSGQQVMYSHQQYVCREKALSYVPTSCNWDDANYYNDENIDSCSISGMINRLQRNNRSKQTTAQVQLLEVSQAVGTCSELLSAVQKADTEIVSISVQ